MRLAERLGGTRPAADTRCEVLTPDRFQALIGGRPWGKVEIWHDKRYQYALCEKAS